MGDHPYGRSTLMGDQPAMGDHPYGRSTCHGRQLTGSPNSAFSLKKTISLEGPLLMCFMDCVVVHNKGAVSVLYFSKKCQLCTSVRYRNRLLRPVSVTYWSKKWGGLVYVAYLSKKFTFYFVCYRNRPQGPVSVTYLSTKVRYRKWPQVPLYYIGTCYERPISLEGPLVMYHGGWSPQTVSIVQRNTVFYIIQYTLYYILFFISGNVK